MILNLTQHKATKEQVQAGVVEPKNKEEIQKLLTFDEMPDKNEIKKRAKKLVAIVLEEGYEKVMIGGAPYLMGKLERELKNEDIIAFYAFSKRVTEEIQTENGTEKKVFFKHEGFIRV